MERPRRFLCSKKNFFFKTLILAIELTEIDRLILNFQSGDFFQHSSCVSMGHRKYKYANEICLLCLFTELGAVCLQFREDPKSTNRVKKISKKNF